MRALAFLKIPSLSVSDVAVILLTLLVSACFLMVILSIWSRSGFGHMRVAGGISERPRMPSPRLGIWVAAPVGAVLVGIGLRMGLPESRTWRWTAVQGQLLEARVAAVTEARTDLFRRRLAMRRHVPIVRYTYRDGTQERTGDRIRLRNDSVPWRFMARMALRGLKEGEAVTVYVDPTSPDRAVLRRGWRPITVVVFFAGLTLCVMALLIA